MVTQSSPLSFRVNRPLVRWAQVLPGVDEALRKGTFDAARRLIEGALNGEPGANGSPSGKLGDAWALNPAIDWLSQPVVAESTLNSAEARRLWEYGRQLFKELQADRDAALMQRGEVDRLENQWQDAYQRFTGAVGVVDFELDRSFFERLRARLEGRAGFAQADSPHGIQQLYGALPGASGPGGVGEQPEARLRKKCALR